MMWMPINLNFMRQNTKNVLFIYVRNNGEEAGQI